MERWREANREHIREYERKYRQDHKEHYSTWRKNRYQGHKEEEKEYQRKYQQEHKEQCSITHKEYMVKCYREMRVKIFAKLGNKCSNPNCLVPNGCRDIRCLQIDHVHGNGRKEGRKFGVNTIKYYERVLADTEGNYQILCANCNWIKKIENHENSKYR